MLKDIPYSVIKKDKRAYEIMLLREQSGYTYTKIAEKFNISVSAAGRQYHFLKQKQMRLYIRHVAVVLGHEDLSQVRKVFDDAYECYMDEMYLCAYLEKKYGDILTEYRDGEPGAPEQWTRSLPPFKTAMRKKTVSRIVEMRETKHMGYSAIAKEYRITPKKARHTYEWFYYEQSLKIIEALQEKAKSPEEKEVIWRNYYKGNLSYKKRYELLTKK